MKQLFLIISLIVFNKLIACDCAYNPSLLESFQSSDFVADITVTKTYFPNDSSENYAEIRINKLFKGSEIKRIYFSGEPDGSSGNSCDVTLYPETRYLVYLSKYNDKFGVGHCTKYIKMSELMTQELIVLNHLITSEYNYSEKIISNDNFNLELKFDSKTFNKTSSIGYFELELGENKEIKTIAGFSKMIDTQIEAILLKRDWATSEKPSFNSRYIISIFYFGNELNDSWRNTFHYFKN